MVKPVFLKAISGGTLSANEKIELENYLLENPENLSTYIALKDFCDKDFYYSESIDDSILILKDKGLVFSSLPLLENQVIKRQAASPSSSNKYIKVETKFKDVLIMINIEPFQNNLVLHSEKENVCISLKTSAKDLFSFILEKDRDFTYIIDFENMIINIDKSSLGLFFQ